MEYFHSNQWEIQKIPLDTGLQEATIAKLVGSRKPILFVEGKPEGLDVKIYSRCYPGFTVVASGSCEAVIHSVKSLNTSDAFHRIKAFGLVDRDGRTDGDVSKLKEMGVQVLPVSEIENLFLFFTERVHGAL